MAQENIKINKKLYSRSDITDNIDLSFSELLNVDNRATDVKLKNFFQEYNNLFYDIPKTGNESHSILFQQSRDYINDFYDPKDDQIEALLERIENLENDLLEATSNTDPEHPIYSDGTLLEIEGGNGTIYFMYKGRACPLSTESTPSSYDILLNKYYPYVMADNYEGSKDDAVVKIDSAGSLPPLGPTLKNGIDINNIDTLIQAYIR
jgi:hypothetical protein